MSSIEVNSFEEYLSVLDNEKEVGKSSISRKQVFGSYIIVYRGQPVDKPLLPNLGRPPFIIDRERDNELPLNHSNRSLLTMEKNMLSEFIASSVPYIESLFIKPKSILNWLSLSQHYGMATRLLDWTGNPLVALWFAIDRKDVRDDNNNKLSKKEAVIYVHKARAVGTNNHERSVMTGEELTSKVWLGKHFTTDQDPAAKTIQLIKPKDDKLWFFRPTFTSHRMISQDAWLSISIMKPDKNVNLAKKGQYHFCRVKDIRNINLKKIIITPKADKDKIVFFKEIQHRLNCLGISQKTLFPDLHGLCQYINWVEKDDEFIKYKNPGRS